MRYIIDSRSGPSDGKGRPEGIPARGGFMFEGPKEEMYVQDLKTALQEYQRVAKEMSRLGEERRQKARLVKSLLSVVKLQVGETAARTLFERYQLDVMVRPFLTLQTLHTAGTATVVRRRSGERQVVDPATVLQKGTPVRMNVGQYEGYEGVVASAQARHGRKGLDVTYFLNLRGPKGDRKRTSVKHGTLGKSWVVTE